MQRAKSEDKWHRIVHNLKKGKTPNWELRSNLQQFCLSLSSTSSFHLRNHWFDLLIAFLSCRVHQGNIFTVSFSLLLHYATHSLQDHTGYQSPQLEALLCFSLFLGSCWLLSLLGLKSCQQKLCSGCTGNLPNVLQAATIPAVANGLTLCSYFFQACFSLPAEFPKGSDALMDPHSEKMSNSSIQKAFVGYCIQSFWSAQLNWRVSLANIS